MLPASQRAEASLPDGVELRRQAVRVIETGIGSMDANLEALAFQSSHRLRDAGLVQVVVGVSSVMAFQEKVITGAGVAPGLTLGQGSNLVERVRPSDGSPQCHSRLLHSERGRLVQPA